MFADCHRNVEDFQFAEVAVLWLEDIVKIFIKISHGKQFKNAWVIVRFIQLTDRNTLC